MDVAVQAARPEDLEEVAALIDRGNREARTQCIHSGEESASILAALRANLEAGEFCLVVARHMDRVVGCMGCECDEELGRGWLWGPFAPEQGWAGTSGALYGCLLEVLPKGVRLLDTFLNQENQRGNAFYLECGYQKRKVVHLYAARPPDPVPASDPQCRPAVPADLESLAALHERLFPSTYESARGMLEKQGEHHHLRVAGEQGQILGYVYATMAEEGEGGHVDFLGVRQEARGRGWGRRLLGAALHWLFAEKGAGEVLLAVDDENAGARTLYERAGFGLKYTGVNCRLERS